MARGALFADDQDRFFAPLAMARTLLASTGITSWMMPNYQHTIEETYVGIFRLIIENNPRLILLKQIGICSSKFCLPSWVPDYSLDLAPSSFIGFYNGTKYWPKTKCNHPAFKRLGGSSEKGSDFGKSHIWEGEFSSNLEFH